MGRSLHCEMSDHFSKLKLREARYTYLVVSLLAVGASFDNLTSRSVAISIILDKKKSLKQTGR